MNLKKSLFTSMAAITLFSASAAVVGQNNNAEVVEAKTRKVKKHHKRVVKRTTKREGRKQKAKYQKWLKNGKKGNLVAIRNTKARKGNMFWNVHGTKYKKGVALPLWDENWQTKNKLVYYKGHYYIKLSNPRGSGQIKAADFKFVKFDKTYKSKLNMIKNHKDQFDEISIITNKPVLGSNSPIHKPKTFPANKPITLQHPLLLQNTNGKYVITADSDAYDGYSYQIPFDSITKFETPGEYGFSFPNTRVDQNIDDEDDY